jgi:hypothetical protein
LVGDGDEKTYEKVCVEDSPRLIAVLAYRLGDGGGFFDRTLAQRNPSR